MNSRSWRVVRKLDRSEICIDKYHPLYFYHTYIYMNFNILYKTKVIKKTLKKAGIIEMCIINRMFYRMLVMLKLKIRVINIISVTVYMFL